MSKEVPRNDRNLVKLVEQSRQILSDPERVYELAGRRMALRCFELTKHFTSQSFRLGIVGRPNKGKTTFAYAGYGALGNYRVPARYVDLDIYSNSGPAIAGEIKWEDRLKRDDAPEKEVMASIEQFQQAGPGLIIGDFPGRPDNPYQPDRLREVDMAMILGDDMADIREWKRLVSDSGKPSLWLSTKPDLAWSHPIKPTIYNMNREPSPTSLDILTSFTRVMEVIAKMVKVPILSIRVLFSEPERVVLEEVLDLEFAPFS